MQFAYTVGKIIIWSPADFCPLKKKRVYHFYGRFILTETEYQKQIQKKAAYKC